MLKQENKQLCNVTSVLTVSLLVQRNLKLVTVCLLRFRAKLSMHSSSLGAAFPREAAESSYTQYRIKSFTQHSMCVNKLLQAQCIREGRNL